MISRPLGKNKLYIAELTLLGYTACINLFVLEILKYSKIIQNCVCEVNICICLET